jgi:hypothetical protein
MLCAVGCAREKVRSQGFGRRRLLRVRGGRAWPAASVGAMRNVQLLSDA